MKIWEKIFGKVIERKECACCGQEIDSYVKLPETYLEAYRHYDVQWGQTEMLNIEEYSCPVCGAADRERAYALWMKRELPRNESFSFLDIAPAPAITNFVHREFPNADYRTGDLFMPGTDYKLDIMDMKEIATESIDFFLCSHVLEHVPDDRKAMREMRRILNHNGRGILVVPLDLEQKEIDEDPNCVDPAERWRRFGQDDHVRKYSRNGYLNRLRECGFAVDVCGTEYFGKEAVWQNSLTSTAKIYVVRRAE